MSLQKGLVGHWTMDDRDTAYGVLRDRSSFDNHAELTSGIDPSHSGVISEAYQFNSAEHTGVQPEDNGFYEFQEFTIAIWVQVTGDNNDSWWSPIARRTGSGGDGYWIFIDNNSMDVSYSIDWEETGRIHSDMRFNVGVQMNQWHHLAMSWDGEVVSAYADGNLIESNNTWSGNTVDHSGQLRLGHDISGSYPMEGYLDDARVYDRALSEQEILHLYNMRTLQNTGVGRIEALDQEPTGGSHSNNYGPAIEVHRDISVYQWDVRPYFTGDLTFYLKEGSPGDDFSSNPRLEEKTVSVIDGEVQTVQVNWDIDVGEYAIFREDPSNTPLMRSSSGYDFPATSSSGSVDVVDGVQHSGGTASRYYYYFDWKLRNR